jgi:Effector-associated domain 11
MSRDEKRAIEKEVISERLDEIERNIIETEYSSAFERLIDFARDFSPNFRDEAVQLYTNYNQWKKDYRRNLASADQLDSIISKILELRGVVAQHAHFRPEIQLIEVDAADSVSLNIDQQIAALPSASTIKRNDALWHSLGATRY